MTIKNWPINERPREKLLEMGSASLSDAELLAIFLRTGCHGLSAVDLARQLLRDFGGLRAILEADQKAFCHARGLGQAKFAQLQAVVEMARRHLAEHLRRSTALNSVSAVRQYLVAQLRHQPHEIFAALFLDNQHHLIKYEALFNGTIDGASVYPREVVKKVMHYNAAAVIFAHNHPSGIAEPSRADRDITRRLTEALSLVDVRVLDHLIVGEGEIVSFAERGLL